jgi:hypothetical protein
MSSPLVGNPGMTDSRAGYVLLESLVAAFSDMAQAGDGGYELVNSILQKKMAELKNARKQGDIDPVFFRRYKRILVILKLAIIDEPYDPERILNSFIVTELKSFHEDVFGTESEFPPPEHRGIGAVAGAIAQEVLNLHVYLDGLQKMEKLKAQYFEFTKPKAKK